MTRSRRTDKKSIMPLLGAFIAGMVLSALIAAASVVFWGAKSSERTSIERGRDLAVLVCARCHAVGPKGQSPNKAAPPFRTLIKRLSPEGLQEQLEVALSLGHKPMPPWNLSPEQAVDLAEYIGSLSPEK